jgi:hypothetical protein
MKKWPYKKCGLSWRRQLSSILLSHLKPNLIKGVAFGGSCLAGGGLLYNKPLISNTLPEHASWPSCFSGVRVTRSLVSCVVLYRSLFVLFSFFFWSLCCMLFFHLWILITSLVSSNSS